MLGNDRLACVIIRSFVTFLNFFRSLKWLDMGSVQTWWFELHWCSQQWRSLLNMAINFYFPEWIALNKIYLLFEECGLLGCVAVWILCKPTFRKDVSPPSSGQKNPRTRNQRAIYSHLLTLVPRSRICLPWRWRRHVPPKRRFTPDLNGDTSRKTAFFIVTPWKPQILHIYYLVSQLVDDICVWRIR
jgi:hypothetical protein